MTDTFDYTDLRDNDIEPLLAEFGAAATLTQPGTSTGDEWDPTPGTPTTYSCTVIQSKFTYAERAGTLVEERDVVYVLSTDGDPSPDLKGTLTLGSVVYQVVMLQPVAPGGVTLMWRVHCRK